MDHTAFGSKRREGSFPGTGWRRQVSGHGVRSAPSKRGGHGDVNSRGRHRLELDEQHEIDQILHAAVRRTIARHRVRVELFGPMLFGRESRHGDGRNAGEREPVVADDAIHGFDHFVADAKIDMELDEAATVEAGVDGESRAAVGCLIKFKTGFTHVEDEEVSKFHGSRKLEAFTKGRSEIVGRHLSDGRYANREIEIFRRARPVKPHLKRVAAFQHPPVMLRQVRVEHAGEQAIERHLAPQTMEINGVATRPFE